MFVYALQLLLQLYSAMKHKKYQAKNARFLKQKVYIDGHSSKLHSKLFDIVTKDTKAGYLKESF